MNKTAFLFLALVAAASMSPLSDGAGGFKLVKTTKLAVNNKAYEDDPFL